jgi:hypothetical protein
MNRPMPHRTLLFLLDDHAGARPHAAPHEAHGHERSAHEEHPDSSFHDQADGAGGFVDVDDTE